MAGTCTTDALVVMLHKWYESTDVTGNFVRVIFLDYSKGFDLINYDILLNKMTGMEVPAHLVRWMSAFLLDREQRVKIGDAVSMCYDYMHLDNLSDISAYRNHNVQQCKMQIP